LGTVAHSEERLRLAIELGNRIIELAHLQDWSGIGQLDADRMKLLEEIFSDPDLDVADKEIRSQLQRLLQLNDEAVEICARTREALVVDGRKIRQGREAISAYLKQLDG
jgi:hypothetical protein